MLGLGVILESGAGSGPLLGPDEVEADVLAAITPCPLVWAMGKGWMVCGCAGKALVGTFVDGCADGPEGPPPLLLLDVDWGCCWTTVIVRRLLAVTK